MSTTVWTVLFLGAIRQAFKTTKVFHLKQAILTTLKRIRLPEEITISKLDTKNIVASVRKSDVGEKCNQQTQKKKKKELQA